MKRCIRNLLSTISLILIMSSCMTHKKMTYLRYSEDFDQTIVPDNVLAHVTPAEYKIMPYDILFIRVITPDPQWSSLFNTMPTGSSTFTEESAALFGYPVDMEGNIDIPFVGKVLASGKTISQIKINLDTVFSKYVSDAAITVRLVNNNVSILGEVARPGRYPITRDRLNIFDVLSLAGDIREFGNRKEIQLIRQSPYGPMVKQFSLSDRSILSSEFYYVMPNDVIYVQPASGRMFAQGTALYSLILSTITTALVIISYFRIL